jgi:hypothetical protein
MAVNKTPPTPVKKPAAKRTPAKRVPAPPRKVLDAQSKAALAQMGYKKLSSVTQTDDKPKWLWAGRIPRGVLVGFEGDPGSGKSMVATDLFARLSAGLPFFEEKARRAPMECLYMSNEDPESEIKSRVAANGGNLDHVAVISGDGVDLMADDTFKLIENLIEVENIGLFVIDPLEKYTPNHNLYSPRAARRVADRLAALARRQHCTIVFVRHLTKGRTKNLLQAGTGSIAVAGGLRAGFIVGKDAENINRRIMHCHKMSNAVEPDSLSFRFEPTTGKITWEEHMDRDESLARLTKGAMEKAERIEQDEVVEFLFDFMYDTSYDNNTGEPRNGTGIAGEAKPKLIFKAGAEAGFTQKMLRTAKRKLNVRSRKRGDGWLWIISGVPERHLKAV